MKARACQQCALNGPSLHLERIFKSSLRVKKIGKRGEGLGDRCSKRDRDNQLQKVDNWIIIKLTGRIKAIVGVNWVIVKSQAVFRIGAWLLYASAGGADPISGIGTEA